MLAEKADPAILEVADRVAAWAERTPSLVRLGAAERFPPGRSPVDFAAGDGIVWRLPGARAFAGPLQRTKLVLRERLHGLRRKFYGGAGLIFIHVPKNAGSSVGDLVYGQSPTHVSAQGLEAILGSAAFESYVRFAIVRDHRERARSAFRYLKHGRITPHDLVFRANVLGDVPDFTTFLERLGDAEFRAKAMRWLHFRSQCQYLCDPSGRVMVDYLFDQKNMEPLEAFLSAALDRPIAMGWLNRSPADDEADVDWSLIDDLYAPDRRLYARVSEAGGAVRVAQDPGAA